MLHDQPDLGDCESGVRPWLRRGPGAETSHGGLTPNILNKKYFPPHELSFQAFLFPNNATLVGFKRIHIYNYPCMKVWILDPETETRSGVCLANITGRMNASGSDSLLDLDMQEEQDVFFTIAKLPVDAKFDVVYYASNQKGKSVEKHLTAFTLPMISGEKGRWWTIL